MYQIHKAEYYKLYDAEVNSFIDYFYSDDELINYIARWFNYNHVYFYKNDISHQVFHNSFIEKCTCDKNQLLTYGKYLYLKRFIIYDNYDRIINIHDYKKDAFKLWQYKYKKNNYNWSDYYFFKRRKINKKYSKWRRQFLNYEYRKDPVPYIHKIRGGGWWSSPHTAQIIRMYKNPEYKKFNRGSIKEVPTWWDDRYRRVQKSWKEQTKCRHQWEKNLK